MWKSQSGSVHLTLMLITASLNVQMKLYTIIKKSEFTVELSLDTVEVLSSLLHLFSLCPFVVVLVEDITAHVHSL